MEYEFKPEANAYERVGLPNALEKFGVVNNLKWANATDLQKKLARIFQTPRERFMIAIDAISRNLGERGIIPDPSNDDIVRMLSKVDSLKNVEHINPYGYILGFATVMDGRGTVTKKSLDKMFKKLPELEDGGMEKPDLVRYSRLWARLL